MPTPDPLLYDQIFLRDYTREIEMGAFQIERGATQRLRFSVTLWLKRFPHDLADNVDLILSYDVIKEAIDAALLTKRHNLVETLAEEICTSLGADARVKFTKICIEKLDRMTGGAVLGVEILREGTGQAPLAIAPRDAARLAVASFEAPGRVGADVYLIAPPECAQSGPPIYYGKAQGRAELRLLAYAKAAWEAHALHGHLVIDNRTELDWMIRQKRPCLWDPTRMIREAAASTTPDLADPSALLAWLAATIPPAYVLESADEKGRP